VPHSMPRLVACVPPLSPPLSRTCSPDNCDKSLFERVLALRERRLDLDEAAAEINKAADEAKKAAERFSQREKTIDKELAAISNESAAFQREKQSRLNTIESILVVRASQIVVGKQPPYFSPPSLAGAPPRWWDASTPDGMLPASLQDTTLFTRTALKGLRAHIGVLSSEADALAVTFGELHKDERRLVGEIKRLQADIAKARTAAEELQILKFGRVIDQEALDRATSVSTTASAENSAAIMAAAATQDAELAAIRKRTVEDQARLLELTRQHTMLLEAVASLTGRLGALEASLSGKAEIAAETTALASALGAAAAPAGDFPAGSGLKAAMATRRTVTSTLGATGASAAAMPLPDPLLAGVGEGGGLAGSTHSLPPALGGATASASTVVKMGSINVAALNRSLTATSAAIARGMGGGGANRRGGGGGGDMGGTLGGGSGVVVSDAGGGAGVGSRAEAAERERLLARVTGQAQEIAALRAAIAALRGGSGTGTGVSVRVG